jgi:hypothetical protein
MDKAKGTYRFNMIRNSELAGVYVGKQSSPELIANCISDGKAAGTHLCRLGVCVCTYLSMFLRDVKAAGTARFTWLVLCVFISRVCTCMYLYLCAYLRK